MTEVNAETTFTEKIQEGIVIKNRIVKSSLELVKTFPLFDSSDPKTSPLGEPLQGVS